MDLPEIKPGLYNMRKKEYNKPITNHECRIIKECNNFFLCEIDGNKDTIMKAKIICDAIRLTKKERKKRP